MTSQQHVPFAGEEFLATAIPDPEIERNALVLRFGCMVIVLVFVIPLLLTKLFPLKDPDSDEEPVVVKWIPRCNLMAFLVGLYWILQTSNNSFSARSVFAAPFLTDEECNFLVQRGHDAAKQNVHVFPNRTEFLQSPEGWHKERHGSYPTTDLNVVSDPFTKEDRLYLAKRLNSRLAPVIHRVYGTDPSSIRANDMFLVRYDSHMGQQALASHTDDSHISFNVLLNDNFEGGGTRFHNRKNSDESFEVHPPKGYVLLHNAVIQHEGLPTTKGTRYILVGFLSIDRTRPLTGAPTRLSLFASWLSLPWCQVQFEQGFQATARRRRSGGGGRDELFSDGLHDQKSESMTLRDNKVMYQWLTGMTSLLKFLGDSLAPHKYHSLVHLDNATQYLKKMDDAALQKPKSVTRRANWFGGQQLLTDVDGRVVEQLRVQRAASQKTSQEL